MAVFRFDNHRPETITVAIEPWAQVLDLVTGGRISIDYDEPAQLDVTLDEDGCVTIGISTDRLHITAPGFDQRFN